MADTRTARDIDAALALLQEALGPRASIRIDGPTEPDAGPVRFVEVQWSSATHRQSRLLSVRLQVGTDPLAVAPPTDETIWVLPRATPAGRTRLRERGVSFIDLTRGEVHVIHPGFLVDRIVSPAAVRPRVAQAPDVDPFAPRPSRVVRALLLTALGPNPRPWGVRELAAAADVDRTTTSEVLRRLADWQLVTRERAPGRPGRAIAASVPDPVALIERWSARYDWTTNARLAVHAPIGSMPRFVDRLPTYFATTRWALTLQGGAALVAPHAAWDRVHVYVDVPDDSALRAIAARHEWPAGDDGKLVLMRPFYRRSLWRGVRPIRSKPVVDVAQLLLDLWRYPVRGREQADHLIEMRRRLPASLFDPPAPNGDVDE